MHTLNSINKTTLKFLCLIVVILGKGNLLFSNKPDKPYIVQAEVFAGRTQNVCGNKVQLDGTVLNTADGEVMWVTSGKGSFTPNAKALDAVYTRAPSDPYTLDFSLEYRRNNSTDYTSDQVRIRFATLNTVDIDAGTDQSVCVTQKLISLNGSASRNGVNTNWTGGGGQFSDEGSPTSTYTPTQAEKVAGTVTLTLNHNGIGCKSTSSTTLIFKQPPGVMAGENYNVCQGNQVALKGTLTPASTPVIWSGGKGIFNNPTESATTYTPQPAEVAGGTLTLTLSSNDPGGCKISSQTNITFLKLEKVNAGPDINICTPTGTIKLTGQANNSFPVTWISTGNGNFTPSNTALEVQYEFGSSDKEKDSVQIILTGTGPCSTSRDTLTVHFLKNTITAGNDIAACKGQSEINLSGKIKSTLGTPRWSTLGTGRFTSPILLNTKYVPSAGDITQGKVLLLLNLENTGICPIAGDTIEIKFIETSILSAGKDIESCAGTSAPVTASLSNSNNIIKWSTTGKGTFSSADKLSTTYNPSEEDIRNGIVKLIVSIVAGETCGNRSDTALLIIRPSTTPLLESVKDTSLCSGDSIKVNTGNENYKYSWKASLKADDTTNRAILSLINNSSGDVTINYTLTIMDLTTKCASLKKINVTVHPSLRLSAGVDTSVCSGQPVFLGGIMREDILYRWNTRVHLNDSTVANPTFTPAKNQESTQVVQFYLTGSLKKFPLCKNVDTVNVKTIPSPKAYAGRDTILCSFSSIKLGNAASSNNERYLWKPSSFLSADTVSNPVFTYADKNTAGKWTYVVSVTNKSGCSSSDTLTIYTSTPSEKIKTSDSLNVFCGKPFTANYALSAVSGSVFNWEAVGGTITRGQGNPEVTVNWNNVSGKKLIVNETTKLGCSYLANFLIDEINKKIQILSVTKENNDDLSNFVYWKFNEKDQLPSTVVLKRNPAFKPGEDSIVIPKVNNTFDSSFVDRYNINPFLQYQYTFSFKNICGDVVESLPQNNMVLQPPTKETPQEIHWNEYLNRADKTSFYELWSNDRGAGYRYETQVNTNTINISPFNTIASTKCFRIKAMDGTKLNYSWSNEICFNTNFIIPTAISPNGDKVNDTWMIDNIQLINENEVTIYNQWNVQVYHKKNYQNDWSGEGLADGVYYYILNADGQKLKGYLLIMR